ncbi:TPA: hypothetical protein N0F65_011489 [Lagenidium giganteum]|uniref:Leucine-rich repeat and WD repeat-containing protein 1 n=1 Tax=Lagenidium giganteum TaxID=4803 RepID=A0AAV2YBY5_9STRA|nr:TPA: hypothetical protein N0F65_011489 [Lagenidium giganteum]
MAPIAAMGTPSPAPLALHNPSLERTFRGHKSAVTSVAFHPNMQQLASASVDCNVLMWNFKPQLRAFRYVGHKGPVHALAFSPSGDVLASASQDRTVRLWTPTVKGESVAIKAHAGAVRSVCFSYCAQELLTASDDMSIKLWALPTRRFQCSLTGHSNWVRSAQFSPDARVIASGSDDKTVKLWDKEKRTCVHTYYEHAGIVNNVAFHPDGACLASGSYDRSINMWDTRTSKLVQHYRAHDASVTSVGFHPSGNYLVSTSQDQSIKIWDVREGQVLYTLQGHDGAVNCAQFSHDARFVASGGVDSFVMVWEADMDKCLHLDIPKVTPSLHRSRGASASSNRIRSRSRSLSPTARRSSIASATVPPPAPTSARLNSGASHHIRDNLSVDENQSAVRHGSRAMLSPKSAPQKVAEPQDSSDSMASTLQHIVGQLEIITRTLGVLEERISTNEDRLAELTRVQSELLRQRSRAACAASTKPHGDAALQSFAVLTRSISTGETSWTLPEEQQVPTGAANSPDAWKEAVDEASGTTYYYNVYSGETSWTPPEFDAAPMTPHDDLAYMEYAIRRLQAQWRGQSARRHAALLLRLQYQVTRDAVTGNVLYTNRQTRRSTWERPKLFAYLDEVDGTDGHSEDFNMDGDDDDGDDGDGRESKAGGDGDGDEENNEDNDDANKKKRRYPRSTAQQRVDAVEDAGTEGEVLDLSGLRAWRLSTRIWNLASLRILNLAHNELDRIPSGIQDLVRLEELDVSHNALKRLPSSLQTTITLRVLRASHNRLEGFSPKLWKLRAITELDLSYNAFAVLPFVEGDLKLLRDTREWQVGIGLLGELERLRLDHNVLGSWPTSLERCTKLREADLSHNKLEALHEEMESMAALQFLNLDHNMLKALPENFGLLPALAVCHVSHNRLAALPGSVGNLQTLRELVIAHNKLHQLPPEFGALAQLQHLDMDCNEHMGAFAACLSQLGSVATFSAVHCDVRAFDSSDFLHHAPLTHLNLGYNALDDLPLDLAAPDNVLKEYLVTLLLDHNELRRVPTPVLAHCLVLETLDLSCNQIQVVPAAIGRLVLLRVLRLSFNAIKALPDELACLEQLEELACDHNRLSVLPVTLGSLRQLRRLDVSSNQLTVLPVALMELQQLEVVRAHDNWLEAPPPALRQLNQCFLDLSNNCFDATLRERQQERHAAHAQALAKVQRGDFAGANEALTELLDGSTPLTCEEATSQRVEQRLARGLCRFMLLKQCTQTIDELSPTIQQCEQELRGAELVATRQAQQQQRKLQLLMEKQEKQDKRPEDDEDSTTSPLSSPARATKQRQLLLNPNVALDANNNEELRSKIAEAAASRAKAREQHAVYARGCLDDLSAAIHEGTHELVTAYYLQGLAFMNLLQFDKAIESLTCAIDGECKDKATKTKTDFALRVPVASVHLYLQRAEAFRRLGQLPPALEDLHVVMAHHPQEGGKHAEQLIQRYAFEWDIQKNQYFVDHETLFRAFDVDMKTGLPRRPEVVDLHAPHRFHRPGSNNNKNDNHNLAAQVFALPPAARFGFELDTLRAQAQVEQRAREDDAAARLAKRTRFLKQARDFKRELRENLQMELEEATQRAVEKELERLAELRRQEQARESEERLYMKYEDEYMQWLVAEEARLEAERRRRLEAQQKRAEAQAEYTKRLARRGGRRQQLAQRGGKAPASTNASATAAKRSPSPSNKSA